MMAAPSPDAEDGWEVAVIAAAVRAFRERQAARGGVETEASAPASGWRGRGWRELGR
jgi:hypothetical protein